MKKLLLQVVAIFILTFLITGFIERFAKRLWIYKIAFPEQSALDDFEFEDFSFSNRKTYELRDQHVTLINMGQLIRKDIARQIEIINEYNPRVIGVDALFNGPGKDHQFDSNDTVGSTLLHHAIKNSGKVVLVSSLKITDKRLFHYDSLDQADIDYEFEFDSLELSDPEFANYAANGFGELPEGSHPKSRRNYLTKEKVNGEWHHSFAVELCKKYDSSITNRFLKSAYREGSINYRGNVSIRNENDTTYRHLDYYKTLDAVDILERKFSPNDIEGKIVIMGYLGDYLSDKRIDDMFYSPLNKNPLGKSLPDMYGLVVHANIVTMILGNDPIKKMTSMSSIVLSILIVLANILFFIWLDRKDTVWKEVFIIVIPAFQIIFFALLRYFVFTEFNYIIDLSGATVMLVSVSLATTLYFGPILHLIAQARGVFRK